MTGDNPVEFDETFLAVWASCVCWSSTMTSRSGSCGPSSTGTRQLRRDGFDKPIVLFSAYVGPDLQSAAQELDLNPVAKVDTQAVIHIVDSLGGADT